MRGESHISLTLLSMISSIRRTSRCLDSRSRSLSLFSPRILRVTSQNRALNKEPNAKFSDLDKAGLLLSHAMLMLSAAPSAMASDVVASNPFEGIQSNSLYVTGALFLMSVPGIWSQVKRAPQANKKRKTFEVDGPARPGAMTMDDRARQIFSYFKRYNYSVKERGEVISFVGLYAADKGQAAAVTFYTFVGLGCIALVLSTINPEVGGWWYGITLLSPAAWFYYMSRGNRQEEVRVKMVIADNEETTDIIVEGDIEEITRLSKELNLVEKGMIRVKGLLEAA